MAGKHLILGSASRDHLLYTIADGHDHVPKSFNIQASGYLPARRHDVNGSASPCQLFD
jgi:hypothetical protein